MRVLGVDLGRRRLGLAISDPTGTLARPLETIALEHAADALHVLTGLATELREDEDGLAAIVIGFPLRLDGTHSDLSASALTLADELQSATGIAVMMQDERLSSREAESRLAIRDKDWRSRKNRLDAAAAAVILQDYLDDKHD